MIWQIYSKNRPKDHQTFSTIRCFNVGNAHKTNQNKHNSGSSKVPTIVALIGWSCPFDGINKWLGRMDDDSETTIVKDDGSNVLGQEKSFKQCFFWFYVNPHLRKIILWFIVFNGVETTKQFALEYGKYRKGVLCGNLFRWCLVHTAPF